MEKSNYISCPKVSVVTFPIVQSAIPLSDQLTHFKEYIGKLKAAVGEEKGNKILSNSLYLVVAGSDDLANTYFTIGIGKRLYDIASYTDLMVSSASAFIKVKTVATYIPFVPFIINFKI